MTDDFINLHEEIMKLVKKFEEKGVHIKIQADPISGMIRISTDQTDSVTIAKTGLEDILELAYATAEHHPYWGILYNDSQILRIILDKWNDALVEEEINEIVWHAEEIKNTSKNVHSHIHGD